MNTCLCGCGQPVNACFVRGHHWRVGVGNYDLISKQQLCHWCKRPFAILDPKHRGHSQPYCSRSCANKSLGTNRRWSSICSWCQQPFSRPNSYILKGSLAFCSQTCRGLWTDARASRGEGQMKYIRRWLLKTRGSQCETCGYSRLPQILVVHHQAGNGSPNMPNNLKILCPTCHAEDHWELSQTLTVTAHKSIVHKH